MTSEIFIFQDRKFHDKWKLKSEDFLILSLNPNCMVLATMQYGTPFSSFRGVPISSAPQGIKKFQPYGTHLLHMYISICEQECRNNAKC